MLTLVGVATAAVNFGVLRYVSRRHTDANKRALQERGKLVGTSINGLQIIETLKACGRESDFFAYWAGYQAKLFNAQQELGLYNQLLTVVPPLLAAVTTAAILGFGGYQVMLGSMSVGTLVALQMLMTRFQTPIDRFVALGGTLQEIEGDMTRLDDILRHPIDPALVREAGESAPAVIEGEIELRDITFGYSLLEPPLLENFSLRLRPGARVALVGTSRSGKSTIAKLAAGLYEPWNGEVLLDGRPRRGYERESIASAVALVEQKIFLFQGTARENLTLLDATLPDPNLVGAARDAAIHAVVMSRPGGYDSPVREGGTNFSGGEAQRLEIARALAGNPSVLILDEATSALDPATEKLIDDNLRKRGCTCLIVAKRLSTIRDCDEIVVLDRGRVVQRGTHPELSRQGGLYAQLTASE